MAASVVDLPDPVEPTMRIRPRLCITRALSTSGNSNSSIVGICEGIRRSTMLTSPRWRNTLTRKRADLSGKEIAKSHSIVSSNRAIWDCDITS